MKKLGRILKGGGEYFSGWPEYIPLVDNSDSQKYEWVDVQGGDL